MLWVGFITCFFVSLLLFFFSYLIWKKKNLSLIAGFDEQTYKGDKNKLAKAVGSFCMIIGILTLILPFALEFSGDIGGILYTVFVIIGTIGVIIYINLINKN